MQNLLKIVDLGRISYSKAFEVQLAALQHYTQPILFLCEHDPPVYTAGKRMANWADSPQAVSLRLLGADCHSTSRGGLLTWHGPGQLTVYPVLDISRIGMRHHVAALEQCIVSLGIAFGVPCERMPEVGVFTTQTKRKFGFIGVAQAHGIAYHGFAINVCNDLSWFSRITPCGLENLVVTSLAGELGHPVAVEDVKEQVRCIAAVNLIQKS